MRGEQTAGFDHSHNRALGVASASAEELAVALRQTKRIARPTATDGNGVHMRVESETGAVAVVEPADDIRAAIRKGTNLCREADGLELGVKESSGLRLPAGRVLRVDGDEPLEETNEASDVGRGREFRKAHCTFPLAATS